ncbi:ribbon-helix-helix domain-containing protein [Leucobacter celer]|uniref:hypothetical protein n=1 Tax=Leucobacter celer TaxID=668625 RepID=UPI0012F9BE18|nr:hypothetical protein [Leucobacter celer]
MNESNPAAYGSAAYRVLSVRMSDETRAQLEVLAEVNNRSMTEETRLALEHWVEVSKKDPQVVKRRDEVRAKLEQETATKLNALDAVFGGDSRTSKVSSPRPSSSAGNAKGKAAEPSSDAHHPVKGGTS